MAKIQINSETILFLKIFLFGKPVFLSRCSKLI